MMTVDLRFVAALKTSQPVKLLFNSGEDTVNTQVNVTLNASTPAPICNALIYSVAQLQLNASVPAPTCDALAYYDNAVERGLNSQISTAYQSADRVSNTCEMWHENSTKLPHYAESKHNDGAHVDAASGVNIENSVALKRTSKTEWDRAISVMQSSSDRFEKLTAQYRMSATNYEDAVSIRAEAKTGWFDLLRTARPMVSDGWDASIRLSKEIALKAQGGKPTALSLHAKYQNATQPKRGRYVKPVDPVKPDTSYKPSAHLLFGGVWLRDSNIVFGQYRIPTSTKIIPIRRTYIVLNSVSLKRVIDQQELPVNGLAMNIDIDAWTWAFTANLPAYVFPLIDPSTSAEPVLLEAMVNGHAYLLLVERIARDRSFAKSSIVVSGRGQSAILAEPYSPIVSVGNSIERSARQLMEDVLQINGVSLGWSVDWRIEDWLVPAGAFNHQGSYMSACTAIADAAGAFIQPDPVFKTLRVRPRMPVKPWELAIAVPDVILPSDAVFKESVEWSERPNYNAIFISGATVGGVSGHVVRAGSAGDVVAPMIVDPLITSESVVRQRGIAELAKTGRSAVYNLNMPILPEAGIIEPGAIQRYVDGATTLTGIVTSTSITAQGKTVRQTVEMQTYG